jgi:hypothetical protein
MKYLQELLSSLSPEWSMEPGRDNAIRSSLQRGYVAISCYEVKAKTEEESDRCNFVAEILAPNNTLLDQAYFSNVDDCIEYANRLKATP